MASRAKRPAKAAGIAGFFAAAAAALVGLLQETVGLFTDRPGIKVAIVCAATFAGLAVARLTGRSADKTAHRDREAELSTLLAAWPPECAKEADPAALGVFPARRDLPPERPYVERDLDRSLRSALTPGAMVVLVGEPRAGASRTALQAACESLPDAAVIVPRSAESLCDLLALDPPLRLSAKAAVIWLDGLERYAEVLDDQAIAGLDSMADEVTIVATVRQDDWDAWLHGSGQKAPSARAVAERARVFMLPGALSRDELARARRAYPERDCAAGIGAALGSDGREQLAPPLPPEPEPDEEVGEDSEGASWFRDPLLVAPLVLTALAVAIGALVAVDQGWRTPTIQDQLSNIKHKGALGGARFVKVESADLRGNGDKSDIVYYRDRDATSKRSDELTIYDQRGNKLVRAFRFQPTGRRAQFEIRKIADIDGDGAAELVGGYDYPDEARNAMVPFAIDWDDGAGRYKLVSLDLGTPKLTPTAVRLASRFRVPEKQYLNLYAAPITFNDPADRLTLTGHRVQDFTVTESPYRMIAGWFLRPWLNVKTLGALEVQFAIFARNTGSPRLTPCSFTGVPQPVVVKTREDRALESVFNEAYTAVSQGHFCSPYAAPTDQGVVEAPVQGASGQ